MSNLVILPSLVNDYFNNITKKHAPEAMIRKKSESWFNKTIAWLIKPFNPTFTSSYITTLGTTIWVPDDFFETSDPVNALEVISHETQHIIDLKKYGSLLWGLLYTSPQVFSLLSILSMISLFHGASKLWLLWLLCLGFFAPIPSPGRYLAERNGYRTSIVFARKVYKYTPDQMEELYAWIEEQLAGKWYYFTWPFRKTIQKDLRNETFMTESRYLELIKFLEDKKLA
jgi:hypothetical protein